MLGLRWMYGVVEWSFMLFFVELFHLMMRIFPTCSKRLRWEKSGVDYFYLATSFFCPFWDFDPSPWFCVFQGGIYTLPSHLSALARDLIPRMLVVEPMTRITIREIREHQWFQIRLPRYLSVPPPDTAQQAKMVYPLTFKCSCCYSMVVFSFFYFGPLICKKRYLDCSYQNIIGYTLFMKKIRLQTCFCSILWI